MQSLLKAMNRDLQGLWIARLARDPLLVSGLLLPVWYVGARTRFLMTRFILMLVKFEKVLLYAIGQVRNLSWNYEFPL